MKNTAPKIQKHVINSDGAVSAAEVVHIQHAQAPLHGLYDAPGSSYKLAFDDEEFLLRKETRGIRFQLEMLKPDIVMREEGIEHTIVTFGSARFPSPEKAEAMRLAAQTPEEIKAATMAVKHGTYYKKAYEFGKIVATRNLPLPMGQRMVITSGGGPGVMEAANRGAFELGDVTIGMNITLPFEQEPNPYITPRLCFQFYYFSLRKMNLVMRSRAMVAFPGGLGTLDEFFEAATLCQTKKIAPIPLILVGKDYWNNFMNLKFLAEEGAISPEDLDLIQVVDTPEEAWAIIRDFYSLSA